MKFIINKKKFLSAQRSWWELTNFYKLLMGGYGSGKTHIGAMRMIINSYLNRGLPNMYVSPTYPMAKKTIVITMNEILDRAEINYSYNKTDHEYYIRNWDGIIWIGSGELPASLKGPNLASGGIDEPFLQSKEVFRQMIARIRHPQATRRELFLTGTPEQLNWGYKLAQNKDKKYDVGVVFARTEDNYHLPQDYIDNLIADYSEDEREAYMHGRFLNLTAGRVCKPFREDIHVVYRDDLSELFMHVPVEIGIDFNVDNYSVECFFDVGGHLHFFKEFRKSNTDTFEMAEEIKEYFKHLTKMPITIYPDATGKARKTSSTMSDHQILENAGFDVVTHESNPPVRDRINAWNKMLRNRQVTFQKDECPYLVEDNEIMVWKNGDLDKTTDAERTHAFDAGSYPVAYKYPIRTYYIGNVDR